MKQESQEALSTISEEWLQAVGTALLHIGVLQQKEHPAQSLPL
jgi:hypothetical protein